jgi:hypothetical protein
MDDSAVERKTSNAPKENPGYYISPTGAALGKKSNVLNNYRSVAYNFTLAALRKNEVNNPQTFNPNNPDIVVVSTKGKRAFAPRGDSSNTAEAFQNDFNSGYNSTSAGRFDMFIDDVDIVSTFSFNNGTATALPSEMNFEIVEPYSMNGFMEAMQAAAITAGYTDYVSCSFVMIIDFTGYPASYDIPDPVPIPNATRTYIIKIAGVDADISEKGTVYKIKAILTSGLLFGERIGTLKRTASAKGNTVKDFLKSLTDGINKSTLEALSSKQGGGEYKGLYDQYSIVFPTETVDGRLDFNGVNKIGESKLTDESTNLTKMQEIGRTASGYQTRSTNSNEKPETKPSSAIPPSTHAAQFEAGLPIQRLIESAIRDSEYVKSAVEAFMTGKADSKVKDQMIDYFIVMPKVIDQEGPINPDTNQPYKIYTYIVKPYKILYNMAIPGQGSQKIDTKKLQKLTLRNYNYIYSGLNTDILDFKINFNTLFYESLPRALGNPPVNVISTDKDKANNSNIIVQKPQEPQVAAGGLWKPAKGDDPNINSNNPDNQPNASSGGLEYYNQMVKAMHSTVVSSGAGLVTAELTILGDPYYITAGGSGNNVSTTGQQGGYAGNQEAAVSAGQVLVSVNFNNPIDINRSTGLMKFQQSVLPFSGVYQVNEVRHKFKNGLFTQDLKLSRVPGQIQNAQQVPDDLNNQFASVKNSQDQRADDGFSPGNGINTTNDGSKKTANNTINLEDSGFIVANSGPPGGLGGSSNPVFGALNPAGNRGVGLGIIPNGVNQLASGIRASTQGLYDIQNSILGPAAQINATARIFGSTSPFNQSALYSVAGLATRVDGALAQSLTAPLLNASSRLTSPINNIESNINNAVFGATDSINRAFGINASGITGLTGLLSSRLLGSLVDSKIPQSVNLAVASANGLLIDKLPTLANIPATATRQVPFSGGFFGGNPTASSGKTQLANPLSGQNYRLTGVDSTIQSDKLSSSFSMFNNATGQVSSGDGLKLSVNNALQNNSIGLKPSVNYLYGSNSDQNTLSPLASALNNANNTNKGWGEG